LKRNRNSGAAVVDAGPRGLVETHAKEQKMRLLEVVAGAETRSVSGQADREIAAVAYDSRKVVPGTLFFALKGEKLSGADFVTGAVDRGAVAVASEEPRALQGLPENIATVELLAGSERRALATAASNFYRHPAQALALTGVTGTNGKTTTTFLIDAILRAAGKITGLVGTTGYRTPRAPRPAVNTTPESLDIQEMMAEVRTAGGSHMVMEVSSHGLAKDRLWGCHFQAAVFTNLTHDHLNFHGNLENYFAAKRRLFEGTGAEPPRFGVINTDDAHGRLLQGLSQETLTYGLESGAQITTKKFSRAFTGLEFTAQTPAGKIEVRSTLVGRVNVYNILAAIGAGLALGLAPAAIEAGIRELTAVPGRFERIDEGQEFRVVVDYAHADDALRNLLKVARELAGTGRIILVFGAGGNRDRSTRPLMGEAAGALSDLVILTSDNPRTEDPLRIINDVVVGLQKVNGTYQIEPDRERAIELAFDAARSGDIVLLAGKGHENSQILKDRTFRFDDREMAREILRRRGYGKPGQPDATRNGKA
jgi:UDP-N-acetylmuramoyl-L-alanyl-D-glutamate--2,6-diaminopimelate ligase